VPCQVHSVVTALLLRFWTYLQLKGFIIFTFSLEIMSLGAYDITHVAFFIADITKCVTSFLIFSLLVIKPLILKHLSDPLPSQNFENFKYENQ
jgi:hypothetical protein